MKTIYLILLFCMSLFCKLSAQKFSVTEFSTIKPSQLISEHYTMISIDNGTVDDNKLNRFDGNNPYTYLQMITDDVGNKYHILLQTNLAGKILFLGYSNNLSAIFNKADKPTFVFRHCLKEINKHITSIQITALAIKCMIDRLNYCSED